MSAGPGHYDHLCSEAREKAQARGAVLLIAGGIHGPGFSVQMELPELIGLPAVLREMARQIEADVAENLPGIIATEKIVFVPPPGTGGN